MTDEESHSIKLKTNQPHLKNDKSLTELTVSYLVAGQWRKPTQQPHGLIPIRWHQSRKVKRMVIMLVIMKGQNSKHRDPTVLTLALSLKYTVFKTNSSISRC
jgi:hypothetical protein